MGLIRNLISLGTGAPVHSSGLISRYMRDEQNKKRVEKGLEPFSEEVDQAARRKVFPETHEAGTSNDERWLEEQRRAWADLARFR